MNPEVRKVLMQRLKNIVDAKAEEYYRAAVALYAQLDKEELNLYGGCRCNGYTTAFKTDVHWLRAEIDALAERIESSAMVGDVMQPLEIFRELRQLSAVFNKQSDASGNGAEIVR